MKKESKVLIYSMINNIIIGVAKIVCGFFYGMSSLFADGMHTLSDFVTDVVCLVGAKIAKKKPTKSHPFGFGKIEYLANLFIGVVLFLLSIFIIINGITKEAIIPPISILWLLFTVSILKFIAIYIMHEVGREINSELLITSVEESKADLYSTVVVGIIAILLQFSDKIPILRYVDMIGSILIGIMILKSACKVIISNSLSLIGEVEKDKEPIEKVEKFLTKYKAIKDKEVTLIKYGSYYKLQLMLDLDNKLTLRQVINLENKIKKEILRHYSLKVKHITIYINHQK